MGLSGWLELITGILKFPDAILKIIRILQGSPQEHHDAILKSLANEARKFEDMGRPTWD